MYLVVDLEMCNVPMGIKEYRYSNEIIQIGAVLLDDNYEIVDTYSTYVKPCFGRLTYKIERLTGITEHDIRKASTFEEVLEDFTNWIPKENVTLVAWSNADTIQLRHEMKAKGIDNQILTDLIPNFIDCQALFGKRLETLKQYNLTEALICAGIIPEGTEHNGLDDAKNTAILFGKLNSNNELKLNPIMEKAREEKIHHLSYSLEGLFAGFDLNSLPE